MALQEPDCLPYSASHECNDFSSKRYEYRDQPTPCDLGGNLFAALFGGFDAAP